MPKRKADTPAEGSAATDEHRSSPAARGKRKTAADNSSPACATTVLLCFYSVPVFPLHFPSPSFLLEGRGQLYEHRALTVMPPAYTSQQRTAISELVAITQGDKTVAAKVLKQHAWNVQAAINSYFSNPTSDNNRAIRATLSQTFDRYRDDPHNEPDEINAEGAQTLLGELQIGLDDVGSLIFSEIVASPTLGKFTREGFVDGWSELNIETPAKMRNCVLQRRAQLGTDPDIFKSVYNHTFQLALAPSAKTLPIEMATEFWRMLFSEPSFEWHSPTTPWLDWWLEFQSAKQTKAVNRDLWRQTLSFARQTLADDNLAFWNEEASWPSVIDEFVEWVKTEKRPSARAEAMDVE
nr:defective in cullin neddylation protein 1 [Quercus suber]